MVAYRLKSTVDAWWQDTTYDGIKPVTNWNEIKTLLDEIFVYQVT